MVENLSYGQALEALKEGKSTSEIRDWYKDYLDPAIYEALA